MPLFALRRLLFILPVMLGVTFLTYGLMFLAPSDPVEMLLRAQGVPVSPEVVEAMKIKAGLDKPFLARYCAWLWNFIRGDMGISFVNGESVSGLMRSALPRTLSLTAASVAVTVALSIPIGMFAATRQNRALDYAIRFLCFMGNSMPSFIVSLLLMYFAALKMKLLPVLASDTARGLALPVLALAIPMTGKYVCQVRGAVLEQLGRGYVEGAISRGVRERAVLFGGVLRNSLITIITLLSLSVGSLLGGTAAVERIFIWRGVGYMVMEAILARDYPVIQAFVVWMSAVYVVVNAIVDLSCYFLDPRARQGFEEG